MLGFLGMDLEQAGQRAPAIVEPGDLAITISAAPREAPGKHRGAEAAVDLLAQLAEEQRTQHRRDRELDVVDLVFGDRPQRYAAEPELLTNPGHVFGVAGKAVERFGNDDVDSSIFDVAEQALEAGPISTIARNFGVDIGADDLAAEKLDQRVTRGDLVRARSWVLLVA
ncbi:hypothetical protein QYC26_10505 [Sphingomonas sp. C3-2]|nr:hypothetical protein [Sphingomonas sp. C3-2]WOK35448.1 hypothetical protein QYC26_10505 [Sphingomonas sp. C3-2]